jgi:hypothetical protein
VAQNGARAAGQYRGHGTIDGMDAVVADGIDTRVDAVQTAGAKPVADGLFAQAERPELSPGRIAMLPSGQVGDL